MCIVKTKMFYTYGNNRYIKYTFNYTYTVIEYIIYKTWGYY